MPRCTEVGLGPGDFVLDGDPVPLPPKGLRNPSPTFWRMSIVAKRSPISATAELLLSVVKAIAGNGGLGFFQVTRKRRLQLCMVNRLPCSRRHLQLYNDGLGDKREN